MIESSLLTVTSIHINNQFGPEQLDTIKEEELCVPSTKILHPSPFHGERMIKLS